MKLDCIRPVGVGQQGRALALGLPSPTGSGGVNVGVSPESRRQQPRSSLRSRAVGSGGGARA